MVASACADVVEALARAGRLDDAGDVLRWVDGRVERWPSPTLAAQAAGARAVFTDLSDAPHRKIESRYEQATKASLVCGGFEQGRVRLSYGAWLRRSRQPSRARTEHDQRRLVGIDDRTPRGEEPLPSVFSPT